MITCNLDFNCYWQNYRKDLLGNDFDVRSNNTIFILLMTSKCNYYRLNVLIHCYIM